MKLVPLTFVVCTLSGFFRIGVYISALRLWYLLTRILTTLLLRLHHTRSVLKHAENASKLSGSCREKVVSPRAMAPSRPQKALKAPGVNTFCTRTLPH